MVKFWVIFGFLFIIVAGCQILSDESNDPSNDPGQCLYSEPILHYDDC